MTLALSAHGESESLWNSAGVGQGVGEAIQDVPQDLGTVCCERLGVGSRLLNQLHPCIRHCGWGHVDLYHGPGIVPMGGDKEASTSQLMEQCGGTGLAVASGLGDITVWARRALGAEEDNVARQPSNDNEVYQSHDQDHKFLLVCHLPYVQVWPPLIVTAASIAQLC